MMYYSFTQIERFSLIYLLNLVFIENIQKMVQILDNCMDHDRISPQNLYSMLIKT